MRYRLIFSLLVTSALVSGCARKTAVTVAPGAELPAGARITVVRTQVDPANVQGQLERLLLLRGFQPISDAVADTRLIAQVSTRSEPGSASATGAVGTASVVKSEYILRYSYATRPGLGTSDVFVSFSASLVDLRSGAIVAAGDFSQGGLTGKQTDTVLREFVEQLPRRVP